MKYFCIADVHGEYDKMILALNDAGFNKETDTLVSLGDLFDRGLESQEVLEFVMSCPHRLLCMGNHELRLMQLIGTPTLYDGYDRSNGVSATLISFIGKDVWQKNWLNIWQALLRLRNYQLLKDYFHECRAAFEFSNLVITHGWIPFIERNDGTLMPYIIHLPDSDTLDWHDARAHDWDEAMWCNTELAIHNKIFLDKPILVGHWHAWRLAEKFGEKRQENKGVTVNKIDCSSFTYSEKGQVKFIAIDGCTNYTFGGKVNVYKFETDEEPNIIFGGLGVWYY